MTDVFSTASSGSCNQGRDGATCRKLRPTYDLVSIASFGAGVWDRIMEALAASHDAAVQMIDTSIVRVHEHGARVASNRHYLLQSIIGATAKTLLMTPAT
jgi:transposase